MNFMKGQNAAIVRSLEDMVELHNHNFRQVTVDIAKLYSKNRSTRRTAGLALLGVGFLFKYTHDLAKKHDKLKEDVAQMKREKEYEEVTCGSSFDDDIFKDEDLL